ncbi:MAG: hypothetical protein R6U57_06620 [Anaerolineales bacterium]
MKLKHLCLVILIIFTLASCDNSLQKTSQRTLSKEETNTATPPPESGTVGSKEEVTCPEEDPHPMAVSISEKFDVPYQEVINWYCEGEYLFEDILLALQTSKMSDAEPGDLLEQTKTKTWEEIWEELGITNQEN